MWSKYALQMQVNLAQYIELVGALGSNRGADMTNVDRHRAEVCFRVFDLDADGRLSPSETTTVMMQLAAVLRGVCANGGPSPEHVLEAQEAAATLIGQGKHHGQLSMEDFTAALLATSVPLLVDIRDMFHLESGALLGLAL